MPVGHIKGGFARLCRPLTRPVGMPAEGGGVKKD